ncbi:MAG: M56 family metallopeptidase, partial [Stackebrandtia sp.]
APGGASAAIAGIVLAVAVIARAIWTLTNRLLVARRERTTHAHTLTMIGHPHRDLGVTVVDDNRPTAYCLPGRRHRVVLTTAALDALTQPALDAVVAHEHAHIRQRHHLVLAYADGLAAAFPRVAVFATAAEQIRRLLEMAADDASTARTNPLTLAEALINLAGTRTPTAALAASTGHTATRVRRLLNPPRPLHKPTAFAGALLATTALLLPLALVIQPAVAADSMNPCTLDTIAAQHTR